MIKKKPFLLLLVCAAIFFVLGFFVSGEGIFDINVHDSYFVIAYSNLYWLIAIILGLFFLIYWILEKAKVKLPRVILNIHMFGTLIAVLGFLFPYSLLLPASGFPLYDNWGQENLYRLISGLLFIILQILFIINIFVTISKNLVSRGSRR